MSTKTAGSAFVARLRAIFPDREISLKSEGQVRSIKISTSKQFGVVATALLAVGGSAAAVASVSAMQAQTASERAELALREARVDERQQQFADYRNALDNKAAGLSRRQDFIEKLVEAHLGVEVAESATAGKIQHSRRDADSLSQIEADQLDFVERLTRFADSRAASANAAIRKLGVSPDAVLAAARHDTGAGGPLITLATQADGSVDPRFRKLGTSLARMEALEAGLARLPQSKPANVRYVSSSYGYRSDPFNGTAAFHAGLDFPGPMGTPIYAAADGRISFVGKKGGYGNCIEITHANGLMTRYGHLSGFTARVGQFVKSGSRIGAMGSTGRSTGPHLHFEVRINDRPVNPRPFLEAVNHATTGES